MHQSVSGSVGGGGPVAPVAVADTAYRTSGGGDDRDALTATVEASDVVSDDVFDLVAVLDESPVGADDQVGPTAEVGVLGKGELNALRDPVSGEIDRDRVVVEDLDEFERLRRILQIVRVVGDLGDRQGLEVRSWQQTHDGQEQH